MVAGIAGAPKAMANAGGDKGLGDVEKAYLMFMKRR
jgi:hypothetical protein